MSYLVLARKWRPRSFDTLIGQDHVVRALTHALDSGRLHHAWLFTGTRGVGKTTLSRILAKSLNCEQGVTATPCGQCRACTEIDAGRYVDYIELDAASNRGVDEMTQLLEQAVYAPSSARYKVYMIDEVHMLTGHAFNAMLKTLEEPPEHVKFILATTDPQKIPVTVLSRCLQFNLKQMTVPAIVEHLRHVLGEESIPAEPEALRLIAQAAAGSMRDALSLTDQAISFSAGQLTGAAARDMLGTLDQHHLVTLLRALAAGDTPGILAVADDLAARGLSYQAALADLAVLLSRIAIAQRLGAPREGDDPLAPEIQALAQALQPDEVQLFYAVAVNSRQELSLAPDEYAGFVMACLRMLALLPAGRVAAPVPPAAPPVAEAAAAAAAPGGEGGSAAAGSRSQEAPEPAAPPAATPPATTPPTADPPAATPLAATAPVATAPPAGTSPAAATAPTRTAQASTTTAAADATAVAPVTVSTPGTAATPATAATLATAATPTTAAASATATAPASRTAGGEPSVVADRVPAAIVAARPTPGKESVPGTAAEPEPAPADPRGGHASTAAVDGSRVNESAGKPPGEGVPSREAAPQDQGGSQGEGRQPGETELLHEGAPSPEAGPLDRGEPRYEDGSWAQGQPEDQGDSPIQGEPQYQGEPLDQNEPPDQDGPPAWDEDIPDFPEGDDGLVPVGGDEDEVFFEGPPPGASRAGPAAVRAADARAMGVRPAAAAAAPAPDPRDVGPRDWPALAAALPVTGAAAELAVNSEWLSGGEHEVRLRVAIRSLAEGGGPERLRTVLSEHFGRVIRLEIECGETGEDTAYAVDQSARAARQRAAEEAVPGDAVVRAMAQAFGARVVPGSVRPPAV